MAAEPNPVQALGLLACAVRSVLQVDCADIFEYDGPRAMLRRIVGGDTDGRPCQSGAEISLCQSQEPIRQVVSRQIPYYCADDTGREAAAGDPGGRAQAIVPIVTGGDLVGVLRVENVRPDASLPVEVIRPLFLMAGLAAPPLFALYQKRERERVELMRRNIYRDVFFAVTNGKIRLCTLDEIEVQWPLDVEPVPINREEAVAAVRDVTRQVAEQAGLKGERISDLLICVAEAATNALIHGRGGVARVAEAYGAVRVRISDRGRGIALEQLPDAALRPGWSGAAQPSMGQGLVLIHKLADLVLLYTGPTGTTVIIEMRVQPDDPLPSNWGVLL